MWDNYETDTVVDQFVKFWATVLTIKFNTANGIKTLSEMDSIIIDNGYNEGGFYPLILALAVFFGADRPIPEIVLPIIGTGYTPSTPLSQQANNLPTSKLTNNRFWNLPKNLECSKYQKLYPESTFKGTKVIILTSTNAVSAGDILPHIFRNSTTVNPSDLGNGLKSILIGSIDGRLQGLSARTTVGDYATKSSQLSLLPSILGTTAVLPSYNLFNESVSGLVNTATGKNLSSQLPEIKIDGLDNKGPIEASFEEEAGFLQAFGFSSTYKRDNEQYRVFNDVIGLPQPYVSTSYHHPYLEDSILAAISEDN
jgi:hypothetical protein